MTILFSLCWLGEPGRLERNLKWLEYHRKLKDKLGYDKIVLLDNASDLEELKKLGVTVYDEYGDLLYAPGEPTDTVVYRFYTHIPRTGVWQYPYCWRGLVYLKRVVRDLNVNKIIGLDTDFYVLTSKLASFMKTQSTGWTSFFCHKYGFPEAAMWVLCEDTMNSLLDFSVPSFTHYNDQHMEYLLPFTHVHKAMFTGDRYGEARDAQTVHMDYYGQWSPGCPDMVFDMVSNASEK